MFILQYFILYLNVFSSCKLLHSWLERRHSVEDLRYSSPHLGLSCVGFCWLYIIIITGQLHTRNLEHYSCLSNLIVWTRFVVHLISGKQRLLYIAMFMWEMWWLHIWEQSSLISGKKWQLLSLYLRDKYDDYIVGSKINNLYHPCIPPITWKKIMIHCS